MEENENQDLINSAEIDEQPLKVTITWALLIPREKHQQASPLEFQISNQGASGLLSC